MDYLNLTANERYEIDKIYEKGVEERTDEEKKTIIEYETTWSTWNSMQEQLDEEKEKNRKLVIAYHQTLADESQKAFEEQIAKIMGMEFILEDD